jgi:uncharacterized protein (TIGR03437 family)
LVRAQAPLPQAASTLQLSPDGITVYDTTNKVNWLAEADLARTNRFGLPLCTGSGNASQPCINASGSMSYASALAWIAAMNAANYLGQSNWQLPTTPLVDKTCGASGPNGGSFGYGCTGSAYGSLYYAGLGFAAPNTTVPIPANTVGPFSNFQPYLYWSQNSAGANGYHTFSFNTGWRGSNVNNHAIYALPAIAGRIPGTPAASGQVLQVNPGGQTVYDPVTDITWLANANLAATNTFGLPVCTALDTPKICVNPDGAMSWDSATQFVTNMNTSNGGAGYLGQKNWELPPVNTNCSGFNCSGSNEPMGNLFYTQLGLTRGAPIVTAPDISVGPLHDVQPYLYWSCQADTVQTACSSAVPAANFGWSFSFGNGFQGTDVQTNNLYATAYFAGPARTNPAVVLNAGSLANGATYISGGLVPGSWGQVKGAGLSPVTRVWSDADFAGLGNNLPTNLNGVQVMVNNLPAAVYYIDQGQVNFQVPAGVSGTASVQVINNGIPSNTLTAPSATSAPGIFPVTVNGVNYPAGVFLDGKITGDPANGPGYRKAKPGEVIQLYATALVATPSGVRPSSQTVSGVTVTIGNVTVPADYAGLVAVGEFQINFTVPLQLTDGTYPISIAVNGTSSPAMINSSPPAPIVLPVQH